MNQPERTGDVALDPAAIKRGSNRVRFSRNGVEFVLGCLAVLSVVVAAPVLPEYYVGITVQVIIMATFALGINVLLGYCGLPTLGHAAHFGIGAYIVGLMVTGGNFGIISSALAALAIGCTIGVLVAALALRTTGIQFLMVTLAFAEIVAGISMSLRDFTGGEDGLPGIIRPQSLQDPIRFLYFAAALFLICFVAMFVIARSPLGTAFQGIRESEQRMRALGYNTLAYKIVAYVIATILATIAGIISAYFNGFVSTHDVGVLLSGYGLLVVILGGSGTILGPLLGSIIFVLMQNVASSYTDRWMMILGGIFILVVLFAPNGLLRLRGDYVWSWLRALEPFEVKKRCK